MAWQRFNRTTNVFEVSDNNGASWQTLVIAAAGVAGAVPPNIAFTNASNTFTQPQYIDAANPSLYLRDSAQPVNLRVFRIMNQSQQLRFYAQDDGESGWVDALHITRTGNCVHAGSLTVNGSGTGNSGATIGAGNISGIFTGRLVIQEGTGYYGLEVVGSASLGGGKHAAIILNEPGQPADQRKWRIYAYNGVLTIDRLNDSETAIPATAMTVNSAGVPTFPLGIRPRTYSIGDTTSISPNCNQYDLYIVNAISSSISIMNGFCDIDGWPLTIRIRDNGAARPIYWDTLYMSICGIPLPSVTVTGGAWGARVMYFLFRFSLHYNRWQMVAMTVEP